MIGRKHLCTLGQLDLSKADSSVLLKTCTGKPLCLIVRRVWPWNNGLRSTSCFSSCLKVHFLLRTIRKQVSTLLELAGQVSTVLELYPACIDQTGAGVSPVFHFP